MSVPNVECKYYLKTPFLLVTKRTKCKNLPRDLCYVFYLKQEKK